MIISLCIPCYQIWDPDPKLQKWVVYKQETLVALNEKTKVHFSVRKRNLHVQGNIKLFLILRFTAQYVGYWLFKRSYCVAQVGLKLLIVLPQPTNYRLTYSYKKAHTHTKQTTGHLNADSTRDHCLFTCKIMCLFGSQHKVFQKEGYGVESWPRAHQGCVEIGTFCQVLHHVSFSLFSFRTWKWEVGWICILLYTPACAAVLAVWEQTGHTPSAFPVSWSNGRQSSVVC